MNRTGLMELSKVHHWVRHNLHDLEALMERLIDCKEPPHGRLAKVHLAAMDCLQSVQRLAAQIDATVHPPSGRDSSASDSALAAVAAVAGHLPLNPDFTFDALVAGRANLLARTAALRVVGAPGWTVSPLFIHGDAGVGKTHLLHAVANLLLKDRPHARVLVVHAESFITEVLVSDQAASGGETKAKYRSPDVLLIDDVHLLAGRHRAQEVLHSSLAVLLARRAQVIVTSRTSPMGLVDMDVRLARQFDSGLVMPIEEPELEMRVTIVQSKARQQGVPVPRNVAFVVANKVRSAAMLDLAVARLGDYAREKRQAISIPMAFEALGDLVVIGHP